MAVALDGSGSAAFAITPSINFNLTTANQPGIIVVTVFSDDPAGPAVPTSTGGLTFVQRGSDLINGGQTGRAYTAAYASNATFTITTATFSGATHAIESAGVGISGTSGAFDPAGPVSGTSGSVSLTTTSTTDFLYCMCYPSGTGGSASLNGWTNVNPSYSSWLMFYQIGAPGTYNSGMNSGTNNNAGSFVDAVKPTAGSTLLMGAICL